MIQGQIDPQLYADVEREVMPIIRGAARRFAPGIGIPMEDAIQEGRMALMLALKGYDYNSSHGGIYNFARKVVRNAMCGLLYTATTQSRCPRLVVEEDGELVVVKMWPTLTDTPEEHADVETKSPEDTVIEAQFTDKMRVLRMRLVNQLNPFQLRVFSCLSRNDMAFEAFLRNRHQGKGEPEVTHALIGEWLGMATGEGSNQQKNKNAVDWAVHKIKGHFTRLMEAEFSDIVNEALQAGKWPMFYVSTVFNDAEFIRGVLERRRLDARPTGVPEVKTRIEAEADGTRAIRHIETYPWGVVIMMRFQGKEATVVAEGRFNAISGELLQQAAPGRGASGSVGGVGSWKPIIDVVPWYLKASRFIVGNTAEKG